jgi:hypothetical protein
MNLIPTRVHAFLDYLAGIVLILAPWLFDFADDGAATWVPFVLGCGMIAYSVMTDYELSAARVMPIGAHLTLDFCAGVLLVLSPWAFGFADRIVWPHVVLGVLEVGVVMLTSRVAGHERERGSRRMAM